jgi:DNA-binding SARP family transcriptional activator
MFILDLLGTLSLRNDARAVPVPAQQKRPLGLLALLALGGQRGLPRERIEAYLWPERSEALARHALDQTVYTIRRALGKDFILSTGRELRLDPELIRVDVWIFDEACRARDWSTAVDCYKGALLDGVHLADSRHLESWVDSERGRVLAEYQDALEHLAEIASGKGDHAQAVTWSRQLANADPLSAGATKKLMVALAAAGDRAGAVKQARLYQELVRQQLEMEPDSDVERLALTFTRPAVAETTATAERPASAPVGPTREVDAPTPAPAEAGHRRTGFRILAGPHAPRTKRSRIALLLSLSVPIVLVIGAVAAHNWPGRGVPPSVTEGTSRRRSSVPLAAASVAYRHALAAWRDGSKAGLDTAVVYFRRATRLDPQYAEAYAGLADANAMLGYFGYRPREMVLPEAKAAALRSLELDSSLASAHPALAYELTWERDFAGANSEFRKAVALDPTHTTTLDPASASAHQWYSVLLLILGQGQEAVVAKPPVKPDPFSLHVPVVAVSFQKWFTTYPAMTGNSGLGAGTIGGAVLSRIDDGTFTHLVARYELTDPGGTRSFKAVVQGRAENTTGVYELDGIIAWGWMTGARLHVSFQRVTPCHSGKLNVCFQGTIEIRPRN